MSGLPGQRHPLPEGAMCDEHPDRPAVANVQGETDSSGHETHLMCAECLEADRAYEASEEARSGRCDWCKADATDLVWARSYDEGLDGPTYRVCGACKDRQSQRLQAEMDDHGGYDWDEPEDHYDPDDDCGRTDDGDCMLAGTEHCDFECPYRGRLA